ncbi:MAG: NAD(P)-binding protein [Candidatus Aenigmatarchaeota archaeon]
MIKIAGGGVSGLTAAINLAKRGYEVEVYEKQRHFNKYHISAIRNYDLDVDALDEFKKCGVSLKPSSFSNKVLKFSPNNFIEEKSKKPIFYIFERGSAKNSIENQLLEQAENLGVKIFMGKYIEEEEADIIATGPIRNDIFAYGHIYDNVEIPENTSYIIYDNLYAPKGYIYILSAEGKTIIASVSFDKEKFKYVPINFSIFLRKYDFVNEMVKNKEPIFKISGFGNYDMPKKAKKDGKFLIGERGFFMDASKGFGIRYAIITGYLVAEAIDKKIDYDKLWKNKLRKELLMNLKRRFVLNNITNNDYDNMLSKMGKSINIEKYIKETRKFKKHFDFLFPLYLWKYRIKNRLSLKNKIT